MINGRNARQSHGFTLIELMVVTAIIAILFLFFLASGNLDYLIPQYALRGAAREVGAHMKTARTQAALIGKDVFMEYDLKSGEYWLLVPFEKQKEEAAMESSTQFQSTPLQGTQQAPVEKEWEYQRWKPQKLPEGVRFVDVIIGETKTTEGRVSIRFSPFGFGEHHIVNLEGAEKRPMAVKLNGLTGALSFYDSYKKAMPPLYDEE